MFTFTGIIPARYHSSRFPGKPLTIIGGKPMIQRVYEQAKKTIDTVYVATDDGRIADIVKAFGGNVVMTSSKHLNGTSRCYEAITKININTDIVINIQGDEPFINPKQLLEITKIFEQYNTGIATLIKPITDFTELFDPNVPKVTVNNKSEALYFSRSPIPYFRNLPKEKWLEQHTYYKHIGIYAYKKNILKELVNLTPTPNEKNESLEQLRWLEHGYSIQTGTTVFETISIDTPDDLKKIQKKCL